MPYSDDLRLLVMVVILPSLLMLLFLHAGRAKESLGVKLLGVGLATGAAYNIWGIGGVAFIAVAIGFIFYAFRAGG